MNTRSAEAHDSKALTALASRSEAHWGYDEDFMASFEAIYRVTEELIKCNPTYVMEDSSDIIGFYNVLISEKESSLEHFYIDPKYIGMGYGKLLWEHLVNTCRELNIKEIHIVTSPQAKEFYIKMGAVFNGETESFVRKGRKIPKLCYIVE